MALLRKALVPRSLRSVRLFASAGKMDIETDTGAFGGRVLRLAHDSAATRTRMTLNVFLPPREEDAPVLFYLAGLGSSGEKAIEKCGFLGPAAKRNIALVFPDTSPRVPEHEREAEAGTRETELLGSGAGFYVDATEEPWAQNYRMDTYVTEELPALLAALLPQLDWTRKSITGYSMGGHGALTLFLRHPGLFRSVSALAPLAHPHGIEVGDTVYNAYFGAGKNKELKRTYDATFLVEDAGAHAPPAEVLVDIGDNDEFNREGRMGIEKLVAAARGTPFRVVYRKHAGYSHTYFFVHTLSEDHVAHHAKYLFASA